MIDLTNPKQQKRRRSEVNRLRSELELIRKHAHYTVAWTPERRERTIQDYEETIARILADGPLGKVFKTSTPCGPRCVWARGQDCECECAGLNHGRGEAVETVTCVR